MHPCPPPPSASACKAPSTLSQQGVRLLSVWKPGLTGSALPKPPPSADLHLQGLIRLSLPDQEQEGDFHEDDTQQQKLKQPRPVGLPHHLVGAFLQL